MNLAVLTPGQAGYDMAWHGMPAPALERDALYSPASLDYYRTYLDAEAGDDISFVVADANGGIVGLKLHVFQRADGMRELSWFGLPCLTVERPDVAPRVKNAAQRQLKNELSARLEASAFDCLSFRDNLAHGTLSYATRLLLARGASTRLHLSQVIDISPDIEVLRGLLSKTVRWGINWGLKTMELRVVDAKTVTTEDMKEFRGLHVDAAGRETRSAETWIRQLQMIRANVAFLVTARLDGVLVSAALFATSQHHCYYGVSASKRELFDKPIGHAVVWTAMLHARDVLKARWFEMGEQQFAGAGTSEPSDKEQGISFFKRSFGGDLEARLDLCLTKEHLQTAGTP